MDPFVIESQVENAVHKLKLGLSNFKTFKITMKQPTYFANKRSKFILYLKPETEEKGIIEKILKEAIKIIPQWLIIFYLFILFLIFF